MAKKVLFTGRRYQDKNATKLYTRVTVHFNHQDKLAGCVAKNCDPLQKYFATKSNSIEGLDSKDLYLIKNMVINVNILFLNDGDFEQFQGKINNVTLEELLKSSLLSGIEPINLYVWIYGLIVSGEYENINFYRFELTNTGDDFQWLIKVYDNGIYKTILRIKLKRCAEVDMDEYFLEDLENFWIESMEHKKKEEEWKVEKEKMSVEMAMLREKTGIEHLRNTLNNMKKKITDYFLPLINSLLLEKNKIKLPAVEEGDSVFSRALKRKKKEIKGSAFETDTTDNTDAFMEEERTKRMRFADQRLRKEGKKNVVIADKNPVVAKNNDIFAELGINPVEIGEDSTTFKATQGDKRVSKNIIKKKEVKAVKNDIEPEFLNLLECSTDEDKDLVVLEEDTEPENDSISTEVSTELENEIDDVSFQDQDTLTSEPEVES